MARAAKDTRIAPMAHGSACAVVIAAGNDLYLKAFDAIDEAMTVIDPARPAACQLAFQRLRFADPAKRITQTIADKAVDSIQRLSILFLPM
jgi:hypothetical protein